MFPDLLGLWVHVQNVLLSLHGSAGPYKPGDVFPIRRIRRRYQVLQHISQHHQRQPGKEQQQRGNSDQLNLPTKKQGKMVTLNKEQTLLFLGRDVHR